MMITTENDLFLNGYSFKYDTPDGTAYINLVEGQSGKLKHIFFTVGKAGTSVNAWAFALAKMVEFALESGSSFHSIINELSNITTERMIRISNGIEIHSGPEALFLSLLKYHQFTTKNNKTYHGPKLNRIYRTKRAKIQL